MNQKNVLSVIIDEIYQLENYIQGWRDSESVPSIEKDLVQRKLQQIYDQVKNLKPSLINDTEIITSVSNEVSTKTVVHEPEITIPGPVQEIVFERTTNIVEETKPVIQEIPLKKEPVKPFAEPEKEILEVTISKTQVETEKVKEHSNQHTKEIVAEKVSHSHKLINETVKSRTVMDVSSKLKNSPIPSIQSAINLNDKFLFIRELFKNNNLLYNQTIERLNNARNYEEALFIIEQEFAWDMNDAQVAKLVELVKRKHNA